MSTVSEPLKYLWQVQFEDGSTMNQPADDRSKDHDDNADWNGTAFTDLLNHPSPVAAFGLSIYVLSMKTGEFFVFGNGGEVPTSKFSLEFENEQLTDRKLIYYRVARQNVVMGANDDGELEEKEVQAPYIHAYVMGYEGKDQNGNVVKKTILVE